jgi:hypothetical protein
MTTPGSGPIAVSDVRSEFALSNPVSFSNFYGKGGAPGSGQISMSDMHGRSAPGGGGSVVVSINPPSRNSGSLTATFSTFAFTASVSSGTPTSYAWAVVENNSGGASVVSGGNTATANLRSSDSGGGPADRFSCTVVVGGVAYVGFCTKRHDYVAGGTQ